MTRNEVPDVVHGPREQTGRTIAEAVAAFRKGFGADRDAGRPRLEDVAFGVAELWAARGTCRRGRCGAVILSAAGQTLSTGYNGAPSGLPHCDEVGCLTLPGREECVRALHAEVNAVVLAARNGVSLVEGIMYVTHRPCVRCAAMIVQAGLWGCLWRHPYETDGSEDEVRRILASMPGPVGLRVREDAT